LSKAIFFDRDGTLLVEIGYVSHPSLVVPYCSSVAALARARQCGFRLIAVTNQSGVARGWLTEADLACVHTRMQEILASGGGALDAIYYCPHHPQATVEAYRKVCNCRKPGTRLGEIAMEGFGIDATKSFAVGDKITDLRFGRSLGVRPCLVRTGFGAGEERELRRNGPGDVHVAENVVDAVDWIIREDARNL